MPSSSEVETPDRGEAPPAPGVETTAPVIASSDVETTTYIFSAPKATAIKYPRYCPICGSATTENEIQRVTVKGNGVEGLLEQLPGLRLQVDVPIHEHCFYENQRANRRFSGVAAVLGVFLVIPFMCMSDTTGTGDWALLPDPFEIAALAFLATVGYFLYKIRAKRPCFTISRNDEQQGICCNHPLWATKFVEANPEVLSRNFNASEIIRAVSSAVSS